MRSWGQESKNNSVREMWIIFEPHNPSKIPFKLRNYITKSYRNMYKCLSFTLLTCIYTVQNDHSTSPPTKSTSLTEHVSESPKTTTRRADNNSKQGKLDNVHET